MLAHHCVPLPRLGLLEPMNAAALVKVQQRMASGSDDVGDIEGVEVPVVAGALEDQAEAEDLAGLDVRLRIDHPLQHALRVRREAVADLLAAVQRLRPDAAAV